MSSDPETDRPQARAVDATGGVWPDLGPKPSWIVRDYLLENLPVYRELRDIKKEVWVWRKF